MYIITGLPHEDQYQLPDLVKPIKHFLLNSSEGIPLT